MKTKQEIANLIDTQLHDQFTGYPDTPETRLRAIKFTEQLVRKYTDDIPSCDNTRLEIICYQTGGQDRRGLAMSIIVPPEHILYDGPERLKGVYQCPE